MSASVPRPPLPEPREIRDPLDPLAMAVLLGCWGTAILFAAWTTYALITRGAP